MLEKNKIDSLVGELFNPREDYLLLNLMQPLLAVVIDHVVAIGCNDWV